MIRKFSLSRQNLFYFLGIFFLTLFIGRVYLKASFPYTHDGENHLARFANYKIALKEGQIPPRFAPNLVNHFGYPVFNYNYPLANILSLPFAFLKINYEITFKILALSSIFVGILGSDLWLKTFQFGKQSRIFSLLLLAITPYIVNLTFFRGNIGELMALCIFPWLLFFSEKLISGLSNNTKRVYKIEVITTSLIWAAFLLSHNIAALFGSAIIVFYSLTRLFLKKNVQRHISKSLFPLFFSLLLAVLLSLWFWLPAYIEKSEIVLDNSSLSLLFTQHFPTIDELVFSPLQFGFSRLGSVDDLSFSLGFVPVISLLFTTLLILKLKETNKRILIVTGFTWVLVIFQLSMTKNIWTTLPLANYIQFPWRLSIFFTIFILPVTAWLIDHIPQSLKFFMFLLLLFQVISFSRLKVVDQFHHQNQDYEAFSQSTSTLNENTPKSFQYQNIADWKPSASVLHGTAEIETQLWNGTRRVYSVHAETPTVIVEPTMNFIGWETTVRNTSSEKITTSHINDSEVQGRIAFQLEPGDYTIETRFTQNTWPRMLGNTVSLFTAVSMSFYCLWLSKTR